MFPYLCSPAATHMPWAASQPAPFNIRWQGPLLEERVDLCEDLQPVPRAASALAEALALFVKKALAFASFRVRPLNKTKGKLMFFRSGNWLCP